MALEQIDQYTVALTIITCLNLFVGLKWGKVWLYQIIFLVFNLWFGVVVLVKGDISYVFPLGIMLFTMSFNLLNIISCFNWEE